MEVLFYWFLNPCIYIQTLYSLPGHAEAYLGRPRLTLSTAWRLHWKCCFSESLYLVSGIYIHLTILSTAYLGRLRLALEVLFYWFLNPCIYVQTLYSLPGQAEANIGSAVLLVSESLYLHVQTLYSLPGQAEANIGSAVLLVSESLYLRTNSLQLTWAGRG